ncbi:hypothetical protein [Streptomyces olivaceoviridis]|uniref:hypothetical protein n=1 Tax=Streptomyces olivaceoviridis TaxID=1921 RepID=UPI00331B252D
MATATTAPRTTRQPRARAAAPAPVPFRETPEYRFKCQAEETSAQLHQAATRVDLEFREVGPHRIFCAVAKVADGSERILQAFVANPEGEFIAIVGPLDTEGVMWLSRTMAKAVEQSRHRTLLDAVDEAHAEAVERGAWTADSYDAVQDAYAANPRTPACEHCGR